MGEMDPVISTHFMDDFNCSDTIVECNTNGSKTRQKLDYEKKNTKLNGFAVSSSLLADDD